MRPQFSILAILLATAYAAILAAAVADIESFWTGIAIYALPVAFLTALGFAIFGRGGRRAFARGVVAGCLLFFGLMLVWPENYISNPHEWLVALFPPLPPSEKFLGNLGKDIGRAILCFSQLLLASGLLGGAVALWRFRRREAKRTPLIAQESHRFE